MLLYTRLAPPKVPKKRSRAGCNFCKEKKKKCDELRPSCVRCTDNGQECVYEPVKPRQRRKREGLSVDTTMSHPQDIYSGHVRDLQEQQTPQSAGGVSIQQWDQQQRWRTAGAGMAESMAPGPSMVDEMSDTIFNPWTPSDTIDYSPMTPSPFNLPVTDNGQTVLEEDDDEVEQIIRRDSIASHTTTTSSCSLALLPRNHNTSMAAITPAEPSPHLEFCHPAFAEFSSSKNRRALVDHFCNVLSHLIVFREENGNPFQQLVLPLSRSSPAVMDAIYALASAHLEFRGVGISGEKSEHFHGRAIKELARLIENGHRGNRNELLAAIMLLVYYEVLVQRGRSNIVDGHLKGAMTIMQNQEASTDPTGVFLERAFRFYDVIAALSFGTAPLSIAPGRGSLSPFPPLDSQGALSPSGSVDTLLGLATSLWPIIHRLSNLVGLKEELNQALGQGLVSKVAVLRTELDTSASAILAALEQWQPNVPAEMGMIDEINNDMTEGASSTNERGRIQSILNNALAYRHSAFVYLYRTIRDYPRSHPLVQRHAHLSITHCIGTVSHEGPMSALLWPLFVAACEATSMVDRELARQTFVAIDKRQGMTNIERAWCIVQEVWRRADETDLETMLNGPLDEDAGAGHEVKSRMLRGGTAVRSQGERNGPSLRPGADRGQTRHERGVGGDLWRRVSKDMGVTIVFG